MKKILLSLMCGILVLGLATGCGNSQTNSNGSTNNNPNQNEEKNGYQVKVNNNEFYFPCKMEKILNAGFSITEENKKRVLETTDNHIYTQLDYNNEFLGGTFGVYVKPNGSDIKDAIVLGVIMRNELAENLAFYIEGLEVGKATLQEAVSKLGQPEEPETYNETDYLLTFTYSDRSLTLNFVDGILNAVYVLED